MNESIWTQQQTLFQGATLQDNVSCDICIIGGGMVGVQTAYQLAKSGFHVILIEAKSAIGLGASGFSTGKITTQHSAKLSKLSLKDAKTYYQFNQQAIDVALKELPPHLYKEVNSFIYATTAQGKETLQQESTRYEQLNIPFTATKQTELPFAISYALSISHQYQCNPVELINYIALQAQQAGAMLYTNSRAVEIYPHQLKLENGSHITFKKLFVCSHYPITSLQKLETTQLAVYRSYLTASPFTDELSGQYLGIESSGRTIRTAQIGGENYLLYGGGNHRAGMTTASNTYYQRLTTELKKYYDIEPVLLWSAQDVQTANKLPFVGQLADAIYVATGFDKWGLSNSFGASELLLHYAKEQPHPHAHIFQQTWGPSTWAQALQSTGYITLSFIEGYLVNATSPKCTHLGCKTKWNTGDQTWDCPCHGSRFLADGTVIEGPAVYPLKKGFSNT